MTDSEFRDDTYLVEALRKLAAEVGALRAFEHEVRDAIGNTNWACLTERLAEAEAALARAQPIGGREQSK